ncbi:acyl-CoA carboxylase subunit epsilon [Occultella gossypii]|uniref:Acyl-CoA carboxylase subunit epsilon n=1 Tax=Occultella gossypii TaxID=2800820 RepID=A0ABS7S8Q8_9MICO|nr:acyl-CoA carboxylase subunit epsilon [Occultella gossypii]MBZ2196497.1 acyl-CoA carboxylase subunit epsilon [Occultella gossypii]
MSAPNGNGNGTYAAVGEVPDDVVRVMRGEPDDVELAALVAGILAARAGTPDDIDDGTHTSVWRDPGHHLGLPVRPGRAAWRWSSHRA